MEVDPPQLTLRDYLVPVIARRWLILAIVVLVTGATYAYYARKSPVYTALTKVYVAQQGNQILGVGAGFSDDRTVQDEATLLTSTGVAATVARRIGYRGSPAGLAGSVTATPATGSDFVTVTAQETTAAEAARVANGFAQAFIDQRSAAGQAAANKALAQLREQRRQLPRTAANAANRSQITSQISQLKVATSSGVGAATQIDFAQPPAAAVSRPPWEYALLAGLAALIGSILLAYMLHRLDPRLQTVDQAVGIYRRPILATVKHDRGIDCFVDGLPALSGRSKEAFRELRVNLDLAAPDQRFETILVTSAGPGEGKSTVARNLAIALSEAGRRVALVDADLRQPTLPRTLGIPASEGLTEVLAGLRNLEEVASYVRIDAPRNAGFEPITVPFDDSPAESDRMDANVVTLVPAGTTPPNPPAVIESAAFRSLLQQVVQGHDVVVIDSTPLTAVSDVIPLLAHVNAVLLVARSGTTDRRSARHAAEVMRRVPGANVVGVVINDLPVAEASAYGVGYGYGYGVAEKRTAGRVGSGSSAAEAART